jgi:hypothetical protein
MSTEPDFNPEDEGSIKRTLDGEFTRPPAFFQGRPLWPFTPGSKGLYHMTLSDEDTRFYRVLAFILIHIRGEGKDMESDLAARIVPLVWHNLDLFRMKALSLCDTATQADIDDAFEIVERELKLESATEVSATPPDYGTPQKKSTATSRPRPAGKRSRPQKK